MSSQLKELFLFNPETQMVDINKAWLSTIKEFKVLLKRDKGAKGDTQARRKLQAEKEFTFIYHLVDYRSSFADYAEQDRLEQALVNAGFEKNFDYTKDEALLNAVEAYRAIRETAGLLFLQELKQGLHASQRVVRKIRKDLEAKLDVLDTLPPEDLKELGSKNDPIILISDRLDRIIAITQKLPAVLKSIDVLEDSIKKELADEPQLRGGSEKGAIEDGELGTLKVGNPFDAL